ncbi:MAG TPA: hypothetical protein VM597_32330 [Gemmataceae bacterium]|jgi:hypothetical protein|nr:hypothetical protein [Gemmataceae bacterium]
MRATATAAIKPAVPPQPTKVNGMTEVITNATGMLMSAPVYPAIRRTGSQPITRSDGFIAKFHSKASIRFSTWRARCLARRTTAVRNRSTEWTEKQLQPIARSARASGYPGSS